MSATRILAGLMFAAVLAGTVALAKPTDIDVLVRVGQAAAAHAKSGLPANGGLPLGRFRPADALPVEERVRLRLQTDQALAEIDFTIASDAGRITLKGVAPNADLKTRAVHLAASTTGVAEVVDEIALPVK